MPWRKQFGFSALCLFTTAYCGTFISLADLDVDAIVRAVTSVSVAGKITQISKPSSLCNLTAEAACTLEVQVEIAGDPLVTGLTVSKIDHTWTIGRWQRELLAQAKCLQEATDRWQCIASGPIGGTRNPPLNYPDVPKQP